MIFRKHCQVEVSLTVGRLQPLDADLKRPEQVGIGIITLQAISLFLAKTFQMAAADQPLASSA